MVFDHVLYLAKQHSQYCSAIISTGKSGTSSYNVAV